MTPLAKKNKSDVRKIDDDFFKYSWEESWSYIKTVVDIVREPVLILDKDFRVMAANDPFYRTFQVEPRDTAGKVVYELGNGQWNIPALRKLLEDILPKNSFFKGFEVAHEFPSIGRKVMMLNARQLHREEKTRAELLPPIIVLAMEDVTELMSVAELLSRHTTEFETKMTARTEVLETLVAELSQRFHKL